MTVTVDGEVREKRFKCTRCGQRRVKKNHECMMYPPYMMAIVYGEGWPEKFPDYTYRGRRWREFSSSERETLLKVGKEGRG